MKNNKFHINKKSGEGFPEPGVPADEAWKQMHELLVKNDMTEPVKKDKRKMMLLFLLLFLFTGSAGIIGYNLFVRDHPVEPVVANDSNKEANINNQNNNDGLAGDTSLLNVPAGTADSAFQTEAKTNNLSSVNKNFRLDSVQHFEPVTNDLAKTFITDTKEEKVALESQTGVRTDSNNPETTIASAQPVQNINSDSVQSESNVQPAPPAAPSASGNIVKKNSKPGKFHFGLQWNINFSLKNNNHYFDAYDGNKQYYMWVLPSAWGKVDISKKHGVLLQLNPYSQQFAGSQILNVEKPLIASVEPNIITRLVKTRGFNFGLKYEYNFSSKINFAIGLSYTVQQNALYLEQAVEAFSGNVLSEKMYAAKKNEASFKYLEPSYLSWNGSIKYNFRKISIGAGVSRPINDLSSNPDYTVRPLNGELYLQLRFK